MSAIPDPATTKWIPVRADVSDHKRYWGIYESSRVYNDGDCVIGSDKVLYICTKEGITSAPIAWPKRDGPVGKPGDIGEQGSGIPLPVIEGQWMKGVSGGAVWQSLKVADIPNAATPPSYGTQFPVNPVNGQEHVLVDVANAPTWSWRCRYNANIADTYKWEVIGGIPIFRTYTTQVTISSGGWQDIVGGTTIRVPRAGIYMCTASGRTMNNGGSGQYNHFNFYLNSPGSYFGPMPVHSGGTGLWGTPFIAPFVYTFAVGDLIGLSTATTNPPAYYDQESWSIMPRRII